jgi:hypothetical protein
MLKFEPVLSRLRRTQALEIEVIKSAGAALIGLRAVPLIVSSSALSFEY